MYIRDFFVLYFLRPFEVGEDSGSESLKGSIRDLFTVSADTSRDIHPTMVKNKIINQCALYKYELLKRMSR